MIIFIWVIIRPIILFKAASIDKKNFSKFATKNERQCVLQWNHMTEWRKYKSIQI